MKILFICNGSGPDTTIGGSLIRTIEIAKQIRKKYIITIITTTGGKKAIENYFSTQEIIENKTPIYDFTKSSFFLFKLALSYLLIFIQLPFIIKKTPRVDIIYLDSDGIWDICPAILYKRKNPTVKIVTMHHHLISVSKNTYIAYFYSLINIFLQKLSHYLIKRYSDAIFVLNTHAGKKIKEKYINNNYKGLIFEVNNGIDVQTISNSKINNIQIKKKIYDACFFGYLRPSKGLYDIIPIWKRVTDSLPHARLIIVGGMLQEYKIYLRNEIKKYKLSNNIIIFDYIPNKLEAFKLLKKSKIFISPSHEEGWGIAIMECLALGLVGVVWDLKTYRNIFKKGVVKIKCFNINLFAESIIRLLKNNKINTSNIELTSYLKKFDWETIAQQDLYYFKKIINS